MLILRDVLRWSTQEVAALLAASDVSVKSALQRARATMQASGVLAASPDPLEPAAAGLLERYVDAFERYDVDTLVALLHDDATMSMPPFDLWLAGAADIAAWWRRESPDCRGSRLVPVAANGSPAVAQYRPTGDGRYEPFTIVVLDVVGGGAHRVDARVPRAVPVPAVRRAGVALLQRPPTAEERVRAASSRG